MTKFTDYALDKNAVEFQKEFEKVVSAKVNDTLDALRVHVASTMFTAPDIAEAARKRNQSHTEWSVDTKADIAASDKRKKVQVTNAELEARGRARRGEKDNIKEDASLSKSLANSIAKQHKNMKVTGDDDPDQRGAIVHHRSDRDGSDHNVHIWHDGKKFHAMHAIDHSVGEHGSVSGNAKTVSDFAHKVIRSTMKEESEQIDEGLADRLGDRIDAAPSDEDAKKIIAKASLANLHHVKHWNLGLSGTRTHKYMKHVDSEIEKRYNSKDMREESEQIDELNFRTLKNYLDARDDEVGNERAYRTPGQKEPKGTPERNSLAKRIKGVRLAARKVGERGPAPKVLAVKRKRVKTK